MNKDFDFIIRVYGICIHKNLVLVADEYWFNTLMTKFPGGGLEYGEGTIDCLKRECMEELGQQAQVLSHFYTTDFFQSTRFLPGKKQLISIYYLISLENPEQLKTSERKYDFPVKKEGALSLRWIPLDELTEEELTLPIDRKVGGMLRKRWEENKKAGL